MKKEPSPKKRLNLLGAMRIRGRKVRLIKRNRQPTMKKAPKA